MRSWIRVTAFVAGAWMPVAGSARAQRPGLDVAVTYNAEHARTATAGTGFWLQGGGADAAITVFHGIGIAGSVSGAHAGNVQPGLDVNKIVYVAGPRYTRALVRGGHDGGVSLFGQALFGAVHGFNSVFPAANGSTASANSFAVQAGAGLDLRLLHGFGVRLLEVDYVHTALPNNASNTQNDVRLAFGVTYHF